MTLDRMKRSRVETKKLGIALEKVDQEGTFCGYASLFGKIDLGRDRVENGAFAKALAERGAKGIRMLYQHDPAQPIGIWEDIRETDEGLFVRGQIVADSARGKEVLGLMRAGAVDGLSIGFKTERSRTDAKTGIRSILQADLWEISIVTFPMLPQARVASVKSRSATSGENPLPSIREFERWLTQDAGLSRGQARTVIKSGFSDLVRKQDAVSPTDPSLARSIRRASRVFKQQPERTIRRSIHD